MKYPDKFWTPEETIEYTKANLPPLFPPGQGFYYSDTNYQLLGLILENVTGKPLNETYREMLFNPLGMNHTYMEFYDSPRPAVPGHGLSHVYYGDQDYTDWTSVSADWAGGGIATTASDLSRFLRLFFEDKIFGKRSIKEEMMNWIPVGSPGCYYGYGIERIVLDEIGLNGFGEIWGHTGFPNSFMFYWPERNVTITGTLNQALPQAEDAYGMAIEVLSILRKY